MTTFIDSPAEWVSWPDQESLLSLVLGFIGARITVRPQPDMVFHSLCICADELIQLHTILFGWMTHTEKAARLRGTNCNQLQEAVQ